MATRGNVAYELWKRQSQLTATIHALLRNRGKDQSYDRPMRAAYASVADNIGDKRL